MKFASLKSLLQQADQVLKRFPFEMLFALAGTAAAIINLKIKFAHPELSSWCLRTTLGANLGVLISLAITLYGQSKNIKGARLLLFRAIGATAGISLIFLLNPDTDPSNFTRIFLLSLTLHLAVAFVPFLKNGGIQGFWQFNKTLFLRFLTGALYSSVLYSGIAAAMAAVNFLFDIKLDSDAYFILFIIIAGLFNTLFFLAGVPADLPALDQDYSYPKSLKAFTQYVLIPLATLYIVILLAYEIKILLTWNLPQGSVSMLILGYAVFGILSVLLVFPIRNQEENKWIKTYAKSFYLLMLPLLILLFIAVGSRISTYGITQARYFLIALACWLLFITLYFLFSKKQNIRLIPISLSIITLLSVYGPQSAFSVAMYSQKHIFLSIFKKNNLLTANGKLKPVNEKNTKAEDGKRAESALNYLLRNYGTAPVEPYLNVDFKLINDSLKKFKNSEGKIITLSENEVSNKRQYWIEKYLGLDKFPGYSYSTIRTNAITETLEDNFNFQPLNVKVISVKNYDLIITESGNTADTTSYKDQNTRINKILSSKSAISIDINNEKAKFDLSNIAISLAKNANIYKHYKPNHLQNNLYTIPDSLLTITQETKNYTLTFKMTHFFFTRQKKNNHIEVRYLEGYYLIKRKKQADITFKL